MSVFYCTSALGQTAAGFLVDRWGARRVLLTGLVLIGTAPVLFSLCQSYWAFVGVAVIAGLGNCVFHPADYALLNATVSARRLGRAYAVHSVSGNVGWVLAAAVIVTLNGAFGWRLALATVGVSGLAITAALATQADVIADHRAFLHPSGARPSEASGAATLLSTPILMAFAYFALLSMSLVGIQTFGVTAMVTIYGAPLELATSALTAYLIGNAVGILSGGVLADRVRRHDVLAAGGIAVAALSTLLLASGLPVPALLPVVLAITGLSMGLTQPARDLIVRQTAPKGAAGKVFGFVYSGLDLGATITPLAFGRLIDHGAPRAVFVASAALMVFTILTVVQVRRLVPVRTAA
jgi:MFS family permease